MTMRRALHWIILSSVVLAQSLHDPRPGSRHKPSPGDDGKQQGDAKIIGGEEAPDGRYPYSVSLIDEYLDVAGCGGALIAPDILLTAGHCAEWHDRVEIGRHDRQDDDDDFETLMISEEIVHPLKDYSFYEYDKMLVVLDGNSSATPVRINRDPTVPEDDSPVTVMGWGVEDIDDWYGSPVMLETELQMVSNEVCEESASSVFYYDTYEGLITPDMMCAFEEGQDTCYGDSGGPLVVTGDDAESDILVGITSWGYGCADPDFPGVYSRVSYDADWIDYVVCTYSKSIPEDFDCANVDDYKPPTRPPVPDPTLPPIADPPAPENAINATVTIHMDEFPEEIGWKIDRLGQVSEEVVRMPAGVYVENRNDEVKHTVPLHIGDLYSFTIFDVFGDGLYGVNDEGYEVSLAGGENGTVTIIEGSGSFGSGATHYFVASPDESDLGMAPSPLGEWRFMTLELEFGDYPADVGYVLLSFIDESTAEARSNNKNSAHMVVNRSPPFFHYNLAGQSIVERIVVPAVDAQYTFILVDSAIFGSSDKSFTLWDGPAEDKKMLVGGSGTGSYQFSLTQPPPPASTSSTEASAASKKEPIICMGVLSSILLLVSL